MKKISILLILGGLVSAIGWATGLDLPTLSWFYDVNETFGYICSALMLLLGIYILTKSKNFQLRPITVRRFQRFKSIKRGWWAFLVLTGLILVAMLDQLLVGKRALIVKYDGNYYFPAIQQQVYKNENFGITGDEAESEIDFRRLKKQFANVDDNFVIMPLVPYDPTKDTIAAISKDVVEIDGVIYDSNSKKKYSGLIATLYFEDDPTSIHMRYKCRNGIKVGIAVGKDIKKQTVYTATYADGKIISEKYLGEGSKEEFLTKPSSSIKRVFYNPSPASSKDKHFLGTDSRGNDILAYLYGGLQVNLKAAIIYIPIVYLIGVSIGLLMGFYGGWFDILTQRLIEIFSNIPFLFVILILSGLIPEDYRGLGMILTILIVFGWMGMTYLMRTAALKEKARDYVAAARVMGASTPRILFKHILPNSIAIIVTLIPFSVSGVVLALTSLDYLGFGLPPSYATWGSLLKDGLSNLSAPWIVASAFFMLVSLLIIVTFIGEAIREAFDPKKFTTYH